MNLNLFIIIFILLCSCRKEEGDNPFVYGDSGLNDDYYFINLSWGDDSSSENTSVSIKWNQWVNNDSLEFIKYSIKDVTTDNIKLIEEISNPTDTATIVEFSSGSYIRLCVIAKSENNSGDINYQSSDSILYFTNPLAPVTDIIIDSNSNNHILTWDPSTNENIDNLIIYRAAVTQDFEGIPNIEIDISTGLPDDKWSVVYEGNNQDTIFTATDIVNTYKYFYCINIQIENQNDNTEYIQNYRYSLIKPAISEMTDPVDDHTFNLTASKIFNNHIELNWDIYPHEDFYAYEIWRSDDLNNYSQVLEISNYEYSYFEDSNNIGSGKSWWYKIKAYNHFGNTIESNIVEGYAKP